MRCSEVDVELLVALLSALSLNDVTHTLVALMMGSMPLAMAQVPNAIFVIL